MWQCILSSVWIVLGALAGIALILGQSGQVERTLSLKVLIAFWGASFFLGGIAQLVGMQRSDRRTELLGINLAGLGCGIYAVTLLSAGTLPSLVLGGAFIVIAIGHALALLVSYVAKRTGVSGG